MILRLITAIQLTRLTMAFGAVSDVWFVILYTTARAEEYSALKELLSMPLPLALLAGTVVAIGLFACGAALNDVLDVKHDAAFSPDRPIPAGRIRIGQAIIVAVGALIAAVLAAGAMGTLSLYLTALTAAGILFYNAAGRFIPAVGIVTIGLIHAIHMLIPNALLSFTLPVWLVMTHAMVIALGVHVLEEKRPRLSRRALVAIVLGWLTWSGAIIGFGAARGGPWPAGMSWLGTLWPAAAVAGFVIMIGWKMRHSRGASAAEKLKRYGAMWQSLYGAAWLMAAELPAQARWIAIFAVCGFVSMTLIREITGHSGRPIGYRG